MNSSLKLLFENRINNFYEFMKNFLTARGEEISEFHQDFKKFLSSKKDINSYTSDSYLSLYRAPVELLVSSKSFIVYWSQLDSDLKQDLLPEETFKRQYIQLLSQPDLQKLIKEYLKTDCIW